jgi:hypothetical protein
MQVGVLLHNDPVQPPEQASCGPALLAAGLVHTPSAAVFKYGACLTERHSQELMLQVHVLQ